MDGVNSRDFAYHRNGPEAHGEEGILPVGGTTMAVHFIWKKIGKGMYLYWIDRWSGIWKEKKNVWRKKLVDGTLRVSSKVEAFESPVNV